MKTWVFLVLSIYFQALWGKPSQSFFQSRSVDDASVVVQRVSDGHTLYQSKADQLMTPASVTKLMTTAALLELLGPNRKFETEFFYTGQLRAGVVHGDLFIRGGGDPQLVSENLWQIAADIHHKGIRRFTGKIVIDNDRFQNDSHDESRRSGLKKSEHAWDAPISAFGVNFNTVAIAVSPGESVGKKAVVHLDPYPSQAVEIRNHVLTSRRKTQLKVWRESLKNGRSRLHVRGHVAVGHRLKKFYRSVHDPVQTSGEFVRSFFQKSGVIIEGPVLAGRVPSTAHALYKHTSKELGSLVKSLNLHSSNYIADVLISNLGFIVAKDSSKGVKVVEDFLRHRVGIASKVQLDDGSGLSVKNQLSSNQIVQVLRYMSKKPEIFPEYLASLPASARSGTLKDRFLEREEGKIRAKTGTLTEPDVVSSLAGYFQHPRHGLVAFAVLQKGSKGSRSQALVNLRKIQDTGLRELMTYL
ncbi:MAG: D-alanyl-D-alanine carboxypeptidase/D-alanyl-D-alanine-endopeptidase [Oligoflexales bacterium]